METLLQEFNRGSSLLAYKQLSCWQILKKRHGDARLWCGRYRHMWRDFKWIYEGRKYDREWVTNVGYTDASALKNANLKKRGCHIFLAL